MTDARAAIEAHLAEQSKPAEYRFPGTDAPIDIRILGDVEIDHSRVEAQRYCAKLKVDLQADPDFLEREVQRQIIWRSVLEHGRVQDGKPVQLYTSDADLRALPAPSIEALFALYLEHQDRVSPMRAIPNENIDQLVTDVTKAPQLVSAQLSQIEHRSLVRLVISLVRRLTALEKPRA